MGYKLGSNSGRAIFIKDDKYYDVNTISNGDISSNSLKALSDTEKLSQLYINLNDYEPSGNLSDISLDPPIIPINVFAVGLNYKKHAEESNLEIPPFPMIFTKHSTCISGPKSDICMKSDMVDYEAELVFVIGKGGKDISKEDAWQHVAGLCVGQDISDRPVQFHATPPQFNLGKSFDTFGPIGPYLVSTDLFDNKESLKLQCWVNDELRQETLTNDLIFDIPYLISYISEFITLNTGDVIFTGTPEGVGATQGKFLKDGDILKTTIEGIGTLENKCIKMNNHSNTDYLPEFLKARMPKDDK
ncbi:MAG: FAA hydrolase family protein [SAR86 cluster bacterium]|jgi:2-keto-4-pentenoate hydratase/2-oxohepta-3-ene-1,7-dioic acid hydratase in catechol pathway|uniref:FAA hydrolase family protein n=1 Tax=SAR86 cluster bacterium TaxID=2030880 RepID=A0A520N2Z0_9GAMM|nr:MAG: FAA hydrolase family protein [SAR86 cluster bacterium]|tara:strand:+ start:8329 stop:9234 length:906 start_codon:yes stop_codon:yes gene_type:complete